MEKFTPLKDLSLTLINLFQQERTSPSRNFLINLSATKPEFKVDFEIMDRTVINDDMGILKSDMVKGEGHFVGHIVDPENPTNTIHFYEMSGLV